MNMLSFLHFLKAAVKNPLRVSTVFETGPQVGKLLASVVPAEPKGRVVELGVGTGAITQVLFEKLTRPEAYIGLELDKSMVKFVSRRFPSVRFEVARAEDFAQYLDGQKADAVISSLPWTLMPPESVTTILEGVRDNLTTDGAFATYVTAHVLKTPAGKRVQAAITQTFPNLETEFVAGNLPPARVFIARLK